MPSSPRNTAGSLRLRMLALVSCFVCAYVFNLLYIYSSVEVTSEALLLPYRAKTTRTGVIHRHEDPLLAPPLPAQQYDDDIDKCLDFGCPIYPPELTSELREILADVAKGSAPPEGLPALSFGSKRLAMVTQTGVDHVYNQDRAVTFDPFNILLSQMGLNANGGSAPSPTSLVGLFDGHGAEGHYVANYVNLALPERLAENLDDYARSIDLSKLGSDAVDSAVQRILKETFVEVDIEAPPNALLGGCTASVTLRIGSKLYIANSGDSQTIVVAMKDAEPYLVYRTRKDKGNLPDEYDRIVNKFHGNIHIPPPPKNPNNSRVVVYSRAARDQIGLAMSRSIGDWEWKAIGVIAEPIVDVVEMSDSDKTFVIAASDGVWDTRKKEFFINQFADAFYGQSPIPIFDRLIEVFDKVTPKNKNWYRDDMTAVILRM